MTFSIKANFGTRVILLALLVFSTFLLSCCRSKTENNTTTQTNSQGIENTPTTNLSDKKVKYFDVDTIDGSFNATDNIAVTWQKGGLIRSEVKVFMDTVHWASDIPSSSTASNGSDLDGDGKDEQIAVQSDPNNGQISVCISMNGKTVNLFGLVSKEFLEAVKQMPGGDDGSNFPTYIDAACKDLDGDQKREIILACNACS